MASIPAKLQRFIAAPARFRDVSVLISAPRTKDVDRYSICAEDEYAAVHAAGGSSFDATRRGQRKKWITDSNGNRVDLQGASKLGLIRGSRLHCGYLVKLTWHPREDKS